MFWMEYTPDGNDEAKNTWDWLDSDDREYEN